MAHGEEDGDQSYALTVAVCLPTRLRFPKPPSSSAVLLL